MKLALIPLSVLALLIACAPVISQRGYLPDPAGEASIIKAIFLIFYVQIMV